MNEYLMYFAESIIIAFVIGGLMGAIISVHISKKREREHERSRRQRPNN